MALDAVSPPRARVFAALALARTVALTVFKLLLLLVVRSVFDMCSAEGLSSIVSSILVFLSCSTLVVLSIASALFDVARGFLDPLVPPHLASQILSVALQCIPSPPIQYCVLGTGIRCGSAAHSATVADLAIRSISMSAATVWPSILSSVNALSATIHSPSTHLVLLIAGVCMFLGYVWFVFSSSLSFEQPLGEDDLELVLKIHRRLSMVQDCILALLDWLQCDYTSASYSVLCLVLAFKLSGQLSPLSAASLLVADTELLQDPLHHISPLTPFSRPRYLWSATVTLVVTGALIYTTLMIYLIVRASMVRRIQSVPVPTLSNAEPVETSTTEDVFSHLTFDIQHPSPSPSPITAIATVSAQRQSTATQISGVKAITLCTRFAEDYHIHPEFFAKYELGEELGAGNNGFVLHARRRKDGVAVAVKFDSTKGDVDYSRRPWSDHPKYGRVPNEVIAMDKFRHENIVQLLDVYRDSSWVYIVQELHGTVWYATRAKEQERFPRGSRCLAGYLAQHGSMTVQNARYVFSQLVDAVNHMHMQDIAHCDIKPHNIVIDENLKVKLIDFGSALSPPKDYNRRLKFYFHIPKWYCGSPAYTPPEVHIGNSYRATLGDMWALGATLYQMITGHMPFRDIEAIKLGAVWYPELGTLWPWDELMQVWPLISGCLQVDPDKRMTAANAQKHVVDFQLDWRTMYLPVLDSD